MPSYDFFFCNFLREEDKATVEQIPVGDAAMRCRSVLCQCDSVVCTSDEMHPQVCFAHSLLVFLMQSVYIYFCMLSMYIVLNRKWKDLEHDLGVSFSSNPALN